MGRWGEEVGAMGRWGEEVGEYKVLHCGSALCSHDTKVWQLKTSAAAMTHRFGN